MTSASIAVASISRPAVVRPTSGVPGLEALQQEGATFMRVRAVGAATGWDDHVFDVMEGPAEHSPYRRRPPLPATMTGLNPVAVQAARDLAERGASSMLLPDP